MSFTNLYKNLRKSCELGNAIGKLTTNWQKFRWHADGTLITVEKFRVRTHHNALRFTSVSHTTVGLAQARPNKPDRPSHKCRYFE